MAQGKDLKHHIIRNTALPYITNDSPTGPGATSYALGSSNVMGTIKGYAELRPGFGHWIGGAAFTFSADVKRIFTWRRWTGAAVTLSGAYFTMWSVCTSSQSFVYKQRVGTDVYPALLHSDTTSALPFEYAVSNNYLFFANGTDMQKWDGTTKTNWGITAPSAAVTYSSASGAITLTEGRRWVIAFENSATGHMSSPSVTSASTGPVTSTKFTVTGNTTTDTQVTHVRVGATIDGGVTFFEHPSSPVAYATWIVSGLEDNTPDSGLTSQVMPLPNQNNRPTPSLDPVWFANRFWTHANDTLYYSAFEELVRGVEEESFPSTALRSLGREITAKRVAGQYLLIFTATVIYRIYGDSISTFRLDVLSENKGALNSAAVCSFEGLVAWLDSSNTVWVTDGNSIPEIDISKDIRPRVQQISHSTAFLAYHNSVNERWLILMDTANNFLLPYSLDLRQWMGAWSGNALTFQALHSGQTTLGSTKLYAALGRIPAVLTPGVYGDVTSVSSTLTTYSFVVVLGLMDISENPSALGILDHLMIETNNNFPQVVQYITDDDTTALAGSVTGAIDPPNRRQGGIIFERWYPVISDPDNRGAKRVGMRFGWTSTSTVVNLYTIGIAYREIT